MKQLFTIILLISFYTTYSQNFSLSFTDTIISGLPSDDEIEAQITISNTLGADVSMEWKEIKDSLSAGWQSSICDPINCHPPGVDSGSFVLKDVPGQILNVHFYPKNNEGEGKVQFKVWEVGKEDSAIVITYFASAYLPEDTTSSDTTTSVSKSSLDYVKISQSLNRVYLSGRTDISMTIKVFDIAGNLVLQKANTNSLSLAPLTRGIYVLQLETHLGKRIQTKKIFKL